MSSKLYESLQREFCPPLDSSLIAVLLAELESDYEGRPHTPSHAQIRDLNANLAQLAVQADADDEWLRLSSDLARVRVSQEDDTTIYSTTDDFLSRDDDETGQIGDHDRARASDSSSAATSMSSGRSFGSPLGFLQAALPHIPTARLDAVLSELEYDEDGEVDMDSVIDRLLTVEFMRELEERGFDADEEGGKKAEENIWEVVKHKKDARERGRTIGVINTSTPVKSSAGGKKSKKKGKTIALVDIRQQHHHPPPAPAPPPPPLGSRNVNLARTALDDPWTRLSSLSTHVSSLLPSRPPTFFLSYFHSPKWGTQYDALRAAIDAVAMADPDEREDHGDMLFALMDILSSAEGDHARLKEDTRLCLDAARGRPEDALDLARVLIELGEDVASSRRRVSHHLVDHSPKDEGENKRKVALAPPKERAAPRSRSRPETREGDAWQVVSSRRHSVGSRHPLAHSTPAYTNTRVRVASSASPSFNRSPTAYPSSPIEEMAVGMPGDAEGCKRRMQESMRRRAELLKAASHAWRGGDRKGGRGGEVAAYYAERARAERDRAAAEAVQGAKAMVEAKRLASRDLDAIDLHGTTVAEAVEIVRDYLARYGATPQTPLKVITGRGTHSVGRVGVLGPAVRAAVACDGWDVGVWDGGLVVRGRRQGAGA